MTDGPAGSYHNNFWKTFSCSVSLYMVEHSNTSFSQVRAGIIPPTSFSCSFESFDMFSQSSFDTRHWKSFQKSRKGGWLQHKICEAAPFWCTVIWGRRAEEKPCRKTLGPQKTLSVPISQCNWSRPIIACSSYLLPCHPSFPLKDRQLCRWSCCLGLSTLDDKSQRRFLSPADFWSLKIVFISLDCWEVSVLCVWLILHFSSLAEFMFNFTFQWKFLCWY